MLTLSKMPLPLQLVVLLVLSAIFEFLLELLHLPAAFLLGPMAGAIIAAVMQTRVKVPGRLFMCGQAIVGCLIAQNMTLSILKTITVDWPVFLGGVLAVIVASTALGWVLARLRVLPGKTAIWGSSPGGATAIVLMAEAFGADIRLVAFMQYLRVLFVAVAASGVARIFTSGTGSATAIDWLQPVDWHAFAATIALAGASVLVAPYSRIPAAALMIPLFLGAALHIFGVMAIELPPWLLAASYALVGWTVGLRFNRAILTHAAKAFPRVALSTICLIVLCGGLAWAIHRLMHVDPLTAYLATSPGGVDSVAIISASTPSVNVPFVMAMQTARFILVLAVGPFLAKLVATKLI